MESLVHHPGRWLELAAGKVFMLFAGGIALLIVTGAVQPGLPVWVPTLMAAIFGLAGGGLVAWPIGRALWPAHICHAAADILPGVPTEPVLCETMLDHGSLAHELSEGEQGWQLRPAGRLWRLAKGWLLGFGIPFLLVFAGLLTWAIHGQRQIGGWTIAALIATVITLACGGSAFVLMGMVVCAHLRRLSRLTIPRNGNNLELDAPAKPDRVDMYGDLRAVLLGDTRRRRSSIPRDLVRAVQLCPWKCVSEWRGGLNSSRSVSWAVQGILVLGTPDEGAYHRVPLLATVDLLSAAQLMQRLASILDVPYLFYADAEGWKVEMRRAKTRQPLRSGPAGPAMPGRRASAAPSPPRHAA